MPTLESLRVAATQEAEQLSADFIGTEHLFLAWLRHARGPIADAVSASGLTPDAFVELMAKSRKPRGRGRAAPPEEGEAGTPLSSHAQKVVDLAMEKARENGREQPGADDLVLAMIHEPRGVIARALTEFDLKPSRLRSLVANRGGGGQKRQTAAQPAVEGAAAVTPVEQPAKPQKQRGEARARKGGGRDGVQAAAGPEPAQPQPRTAVPAPAPEPVEEAVPASRIRTSRESTWSFSDLLLVGIPAAVALHFAGGRADLALLAAVLGAAGAAGRVTAASEQLSERTGGVARAICRLILPGLPLALIGSTLVQAGETSAAVTIGAGAAAASVAAVLGIAFMAAGIGRGPTAPSAGTAESVGAAVTLLLVPVALLLFTPASPDAVEPVAIAAATGLLLFAAGAAIQQGIRNGPAAPEAEAGSGDGTWSVGRSLVELAVGLVLIAAVGMIAAGSLTAVASTVGGDLLAFTLFLAPLVIQLAAGGTAIRAGRVGAGDMAHRIVGRQVWSILTFSMPVIMLAGLVSGGAPVSLLVSPWPALVLAIAAGGWVAADRIVGMSWRNGLQLFVLYAMLAVATWLSH